MKIHQQVIGKIKDQAGVAAPLVTVMIVMLIGLVALAVDIGYVMVTKNELQNVADAAALAAARKLGNIYQGMSYTDQQTYVCDSDDQSTIINLAKEVAGKNRAGGENIIINDADVVIGEWDGQTLNPTLTRPDAVEVTAHRDDASANGPITTFFAKIFDVHTFNVWADATAALTGQGTAGEREIELPVGISTYFFEQDPQRCNDFVKFSPTNDPDSCAGWTSFDLSPSADITIRNILNQVEGYENPDTQVGETQYEFIGGDLSTQTFDALLMLFKVKGYDYDVSTSNPEEGIYVPVEITTDEEGVEVPVTGTHPDGVPLYDDDGVTQLLYPDGTGRNHHVWKTTVVVYDWPDCSNPNTSIMIVGFSTVLLTDVKGAPDKTLIGQLQCNLVSNEDNRGGGAEYGTMGSIPGLVE